MTILLADSCTATRVTVANHLRRWGHTVYEASTSNDAYSLFLEAPDLNMVIVEFELPGLNGLEIADKVAERSPNMHIWLVTSGAEYIDRLRDEVPISSVDIVMHKSDLLYHLKEAHIIHARHAA